MPTVWQAQSMASRVPPLVLDIRIDAKIHQGLHPNGRLGLFGLLKTQTEFHLNDNSSQSLPLGNKEQLMSRIQV